MAREKHREYVELKHARSFLARLVRVVRAFLVHQDALMASACAYGVILSFVPLLVAGISLLGYVTGGTETALNGVMHSISMFIPLQTGFMRTNLERVLAHSGVLGGIGAAGLLYSAQTTFMALFPAMNGVWEVPERRRWWTRRLKALECSLAAILLIGANILLSAFASHLFHAGMPPLLESTLHLFAEVLLPLLLSLVLFNWLYRVLPCCEVEPWPAMYGSLTASVLWEISKRMFEYYISRTNAYNFLYGSLSSVMVLFVWVYFSMVVLLFGAEFSADLQKRMNTGKTL